MTWYRIRHPRAQRAINRRLGIPPQSLAGRNGHRAMIAYRCAVFGGILLSAIRR